MPFLVSIETSGNQAFIFESNKLRENVGASELVSSVCRFGEELLQSQIRADAGRLRCGEWLHAEELGLSASGLTEQVKRFHDLNQPTPSAVIVAASGKLLVRAATREIAEQFVRCVTLWSVLSAPGLTVRGAIAEITGDGAADFQNAMLAIHQRHTELAALLPSSEARLQRLPCVADCATTRYPAERLAEVGGGKTGALSAVAIAKRRFFSEGTNRLGAIAKGKHQDLKLPRSLNDIEMLEQVQWLGVVHIDGNGLGSMFWNFQSLANPTSADDYATQLRAFSSALESVTIAAFQRAVHSLWDHWCEQHATQDLPLPIVPLVLGGDDLTVVLDGKLAILFAREYLRMFEEMSALNPVISALAIKRPGVKHPHLAASAGIAIVKPHFPFYDAYNLCEQLLGRAKSIKKFCPGAAASALDFHVLRDSSCAELDRIAESLRLRVNEQDREIQRELFVRPIVVSPTARYAGLNDVDRQWANDRHIDRLSNCVQSLRQPLNRNDSADDRTLVSSSFAHRLRDSLFQPGRDVQIIALEKLRRDMTTLNCFIHQRNQADTLFEVQADGWHRTRFLDAIEIEPFWPHDPANGDDPEDAALSNQTAALASENPA